ncbi:allantoinase AllB [Pseudactinotalea suaedae]|uniref:allantoinase AllB n=1 Tax=Pseudactinotalea suaedae TaxID=1524924 RepID=UPI0012E28A25|nr:allantoinase AllB [Pseudactinotalea suaedae]
MTDRLDLVVRGERVLTGDRFQPCEVGARAGRIEVIAPLGTALAGDRVVELAADEVLLPGLVDTHVHVNEPGRTDWEGFETATRAAARGGVTTLVDMPLNSIPPTVSVAALREKVAATEGKRHVDVGFWGGATPESLGELRSLHDAGVMGFKCFLLHSGVEEFGHLDGDGLEHALRELAGYDALMVVHAEDAEAIDQAPPAAGAGYDGFLRSRPRAAENRAIAEVIERARRTGARVHVLHLSSAEALPMIASARRDGVRITVETCPHYLALAAEDVPDGATAFKCCPPIREASNRELLWQGLQDGTIDCVVSDHSPSTIDLKNLETGDFGTAWGGVASLQLGLSIVWTAARERGIDLAEVVRWMSTAPAALVGLGAKGAIAVGRDADLVVLAPDEAFVVDPAALEHRNAITPYAGATLWGVVRRTVLAGVEIDVAFDRPAGRLIWRGAS